MMNKVIKISSSSTIIEIKVQFWSFAHYFSTVLLNKKFQTNVLETIFMFFAFLLIQKQDTKGSSE